MTPSTPLCRWVGGWARGLGLLVSLPTPLMFSGRGSCSARFSHLYTTPHTLPSLIPPGCACCAMLQALGGAAAHPQEEAAEEEGPVFRGFGSPLKPAGPDSPALAPVSIGAAICPAGASKADAGSEEEADATSAPSPGGLVGGCCCPVGLAVHGRGRGRHATFVACLLRLSPHLRVSCCARQSWCFAQSSNFIRPLHHIPPSVFAFLGPYTPSPSPPAHLTLAQACPLLSGTVLVFLGPPIPSPSPRPQLTSLPPLLPA